MVVVDTYVCMRRYGCMRIHTCTWLPLYRIVAIYGLQVVIATVKVSTLFTISNNYNHCVSQTSISVQCLTHG
jgi:hypothetical protein